MKNSMLTILAILLSWACQAMPTFSAPTGCIKYDAQANKLILKAQYSLFVWSNFIAGQNTWIYVRPSSSAANFIGPFASSSCDPLNETCEYDISSLIGSLAGPGCYEFFAVASFSTSTPTEVPPTNPGIADLHPIPGPIWLRPNGTMKWNLANDGDGTNEQWGREACICPESDPLPSPITCNSEFILNMSYQSNQDLITTLAPCVVSATLYFEHVGSTYTYDFGTGGGPGSSNSQIVVPNPFLTNTYTLCVTERMANGCECTTCVEYVIPTTKTHGTPWNGSEPCVSGKGVNPELAGHAGIKTNLSPTSGMAVDIKPNPAKTSAEITFQLSDKTPVKVKVIDATGKCIYSSDEQTYGAGSQKIMLNTSNYPAGLYLIQVSIGSNITTKKLIVNK